MKCRRDADAVAIAKEMLLTTESGGSRQRRTAARLARDSMSATERDVALSLLDALNEEILASGTEIHEYLAQRWRYRAPCAYQSPWRYLDVSKLPQLLTQLSAWSDVIQYTRKEFADRVHVATEHMHGKSRSLGHYISAMSRALKAMMHSAAEESNEWEDCLNSALAHARKSR